MRKAYWRRLLVSAMSVGLLVTGAAVTSAQAEEGTTTPELKTLNLVAINDFHGQLDDHVVQWAATVKQIRAEAAPGSSLLISAGDSIGASVHASDLQRDNPTIDLLNLIGMDVSAVGNHEFDRGYQDLVDRVIPRASFPILAANIEKADGSLALDPSATFTVDGLKVAVIGAVTQETPTLVPDGTVDGLTFQEPTTAINDEVDRLNSLPESERPDVMVVSIHEGAPWGSWGLTHAQETSEVFHRIVNGISADVDAIITGHTHITYAWDAPVPGVPGVTRPIIQTGSLGENVGQVKLTVDADTGDVASYSVQNVARVTTSEADLIAGDPQLAEVAQIRDDALAFIDTYDDAVATAAAAEDDYEVAVQARTAAQDDYVSHKTVADAAAADFQAADEAAHIAKAAYDEAVEAANTAKDEWTAAHVVVEEARAEYNAAVAASQAAVDDFTAASAVVNEARAKYDAAVTKANEAKAAYTEAIAQMKAAQVEYTEAMEATLYEAATAAHGVWTESLAAAQQAVETYDAAIAEGLAAVDEYQVAMADVRAAVDAYSAAVADGQAAVAKYEAAMADAQRAADEYAAAVAAGQDAAADWSEALDARAAAHTAYEAAMAEANAAIEEFNLAQAAVEAAVAVWEAAMAVIGSVGGVIGGIGGIVGGVGDILNP